MHKNVHPPSETIFAVLTADIVASRDLVDSAKILDEKLKIASSDHRKKRRIVSNYAITAGDEFQGLLKQPREIPRVVFDLRRYFYPIKLWIGIGLGQVQNPHLQPINVYAGGVGFQRARAAVDRLKAGRRKNGRMTMFVSDNQIFDQIANTIYFLHDSLLARMKPKQWETMNVHLSAQSQGDAAERLKVEQSTVSRNLARGYSKQIEDTIQTMESAIDLFWPQE